MLPSGPLNHVMAPAFGGFNRLLLQAAKRITSPFTASQRNIATVPFHMQTPTPPPREYNPDGSPKVYRLNQVTYDHKYDWERWHFQPVGVFHTVYRGYFARDQKPIQAALLQYHTAVVAVPVLLVVFGLSFFFMSVSVYAVCSSDNVVTGAKCRGFTVAPSRKTVPAPASSALKIFSVGVAAYISENIDVRIIVAGIRPKRYTIEWMLASKERDRAENSNPCTRYLDRRRKERGPNWILEDYLPWHPFFLNMKRYHSDTEYAQYKAKREGKAAEAEESE